MPSKDPRGTSATTNKNQQSSGHNTPRPNSPGALPNEFETPKHTKKTIPNSKRAPSSHRRPSPCLSSLDYGRGAQAPPLPPPSVFFRIRRLNQSPPYSTPEDSTSASVPFLKNARLPAATESNIKQVQVTLHDHKNKQ